MSDSTTPSIKIAVASHKDYWMPDDSLYIPMQVGAKGKESIPGFQRDDEGDNISDKNPRYCELTGLYWAWKNLDADYIGLAHYRRHFKGNGERGVLTAEEARALIADDKVILPKRRNYYIETIESHYSHTFDKAHLDSIRNAILEKSPEVIEAFDAHMKQRGAHIWNMAIMPKAILDRYCEWLFLVLGEAEKNIDFTDMTPFEERVMGRLSELLLDPWLSANGIEYVEVPVIGMEKTDWVKKGMGFLSAKFSGKKYTESF